eukprot:SAG31_NODE_2339_length_5920_cov_15.209414_7_plen_380_part_00
MLSSVPPLHTSSSSSSSSSSSPSRRARAAAPAAEHMPMAGTASAGGTAGQARRPEPPQPPPPPPKDAPWHIYHQPGVVVTVAAPDVTMQQDQESAAKDFSETLVSMGWAKHVVSRYCISATVGLAVSPLLSLRHHARSAATPSIYLSPMQARFNSAVPPCAGLSDRRRVRSKGLSTFVYSTRPTPRRARPLSGRSAVANQLLHYSTRPTPRRAKPLSGRSAVANQLLHYSTRPTPRRARPLSGRRPTPRRARPLSGRRPTPRRARPLSGRSAVANQLLHAWKRMRTQAQRVHRGRCSCSRPAVRRTLPTRRTRFVNATALCLHGPALCSCTMLSPQATLIDQLVNKMGFSKYIVQKVMRDAKCELPKFKLLVADRELSR